MIERKIESFGYGRELGLSKESRVERQNTLEERMLQNKKDER